MSALGPRQRSPTFRVTPRSRGKIGGRQGRRAASARTQPHPLPPLSGVSRWLSSDLPNPQPLAVSQLSSEKRKQSTNPAALASSSTPTPAPGAHLLRKEAGGGGAEEGGGEGAKVSGSGALGDAPSAARVVEAGCGGAERERGRQRRVPTACGGWKDLASPGRVPRAGADSASPLSPPLQRSEAPFAAAWARPPLRFCLSPRPPSLAI